MKKDKTCATCAQGRGPFATTLDQGKSPFFTLGIQGKWYCKRTRNYEKSTHYCAEWKEKENEKR